MTLRLSGLLLIAAVAGFSAASSSRAKRYNPEQHRPHVSVIDTATNTVIGSADPRRPQPESRGGHPGRQARSMSRTAVTTPVLCRSATTQQFATRPIQRPFHAVRLPNLDLAEATV